VFVLLMSFLLLLAHFIGVGISVWLRIAVASARFQYQPLTQTAIDEPPLRLSYKDLHISLLRGAKSFAIARRGDVARAGPTSGDISAKGRS